MEQAPLAFSVRIPLHKEWIPDCDRLWLWISILIRQCVKRRQTNHDPVRLLNRESCRRLARRNPKCNKKVRQLHIWIRRLSLENRTCSDFPVRIMIDVTSESRMWLIVTVKQLVRIVQCVSRRQTIVRLPSLLDKISARWVSRANPKDSVPHERIPIVTDCYDASVFLTDSCNVPGEDKLRLLSRDSWLWLSRLNPSCDSNSIVVSRSESLTRCWTPSWRYKFVTGYQDPWRMALNNCLVIPSGTTF